MSTSSVTEAEAELRALEREKAGFGAALETAIGSGDPERIRELRARAAELPDLIAMAKVALYDAQIARTRAEQETEAAKLPSLERTHTESVVAVDAATAALRAARDNLDLSLSNLRRTQSVVAAQTAVLRDLERQRQYVLTSAKQAEPEPEHVGGQTREVDPLDLPAEAVTGKRAVYVGPSGRRP